MLQSINRSSIDDHVLLKAGVLPPGVALPNMTREEETSIKAGGKDLLQLTSFCQKISDKEKDRKPEDSDDEAEAAAAARMRTDEEEESLNPVTGQSPARPVKPA